METTNEIEAAMAAWLKEAEEADRIAGRLAYHATRALYAAEVAAETIAGRGESIKARIARHYLSEYGPEWTAERERLLAEEKAERIAGNGAGHA
jgi:hypothetical protein